MLILVNMITLFFILNNLDLVRVLGRYWNMVYMICLYGKYKPVTSCVLLVIERVKRNGRMHCTLYHSNIVNGDNIRSDQG